MAKEKEAIHDDGEEVGLRIIEGEGGTILIEADWRTILSALLVTLVHSETAEIDLDTIEAIDVEKCKVYWRGLGLDTIMGFALPRKVGR